MTVFTVRHVTTYDYRRPVRFGEHRLMFRPRDSADQRLIHAGLRVTPEPLGVRWIHDVFGNCVTLVGIEASARQLRFESLIRLEHNAAGRPRVPDRRGGAQLSLRLSASRRPPTSRRPIAMQ